MNFFRTVSITALVAFALASCGGAIDATIGGNLSGLASNAKVELENLTNGDVLTLSANGDFTFSEKVTADTNYNVVVNTQPVGQTCSVVKGVGLVSSDGSNVKNIQVTCVAGSTTNSTITADISGLGLDNLGVGKRVVLLNNGVDELTVVGTSNGSPGVKAFPTLLSPGAVYSITVKTQPVGLTCTVTDGVGRVPTTGSPPSALVTCM